MMTTQRQCPSNSFQRSNFSAGLELDAWRCPAEISELDSRIAIATVCAERREQPEYLNLLLERAFGPWIHKNVCAVALARQVHGDRIFSIRHPSAPGRAAGNGFSSSDCLLPVIRPGDGDGLWTDQPGVCLAIRTADCLPAAVWDSRGARIALLHSGWRGTLANIVGKAILALRQEGSRPENLKMWIGPGICGVHLEVGPEVTESFRARWPGKPECWESNRLDLAGLIRHQAREAGLNRESIFQADICTHAGGAGLPSHRREGANRTRTLFTLAVLCSSMSET